MKSAFLVDVAGLNCRFFVLC